MPGYTAEIGATAEGLNNKAGGVYSHVEGQMCETTTDCGHAEGYGCTAGAGYAHAGGYDSFVNGSRGFAHGYHAMATQTDEVAFGKYNNTGANVAFSYGNGTAENARHNLMTVYNDGRVVMDESDALVSGGNLAVVELTRTMSAQRTAGSYVFVVADKKTYHIDTTISASGTLTPGTNATEAIVFDEIQTLTSQLTSMLKSKYVEITDLTFTAGSNIDLGTIATATGIPGLTYSGIKGLSLLMAGGNQNFDFGNLYCNRTNGHMYFRPSTTQSSAFVFFTVLY
jgi:hypothetical protein